MLSAKIKLEWRAGYSDLAATARRKQSIASSVRPYREQACAQNVERIDVVRANLERSASARPRLTEMPQPGRELRPVRYKPRRNPACSRAPVETVPPPRPTGLGSRAPCRGCNGVRPSPA